MATIVIAHIMIIILKKKKKNIMKRRNIIRNLNTTLLSLSSCKYCTLSLRLHHKNLRVLSQIVIMIIL